MKKSLLVSTVAGFLTLLVGVDATQAGPFFGWYGRSVGISTPFFSAEFGYPYYGYGWYSGPYYDGWYYAPPPYYYGWGFRYRRPFRSYYYSYWNEPPYADSYYSNPGYAANNGDSSYAGNSGSDPTQSYYYSPDANDRAALLRVIVPTVDARVWVEGKPTRQKGTERLFSSPPLEQGKTYTYTIRAKWMENGREVSRQKQLRVVAGREFVANFTDRRPENVAKPRQLDRARQRDQDEGTPNGKPESVGGKREANGPNMVEVKAVKTDKGQLIVTDPAGKNQRTYRVAAETEIVIDEKKSDLKALQPGMHVSLILKAGSSEIVAKIEAKTPVSSSVHKGQAKPSAPIP